MGCGLSIGLSGLAMDVILGGCFRGCFSTRTSRTVFVLAASLWLARLSRGSGPVLPDWVMSLRAARTFPSIISLANSLAV